jgi:hypothetical protein
MTSPGQRPLMFGIYPGSAVGDDAGGIALGPPDVPGRINDALDELQGPAARPFMVRAYRIFTEAGQPAPRQTPEGFGRYLRRGRTLDLVASYHSAGGDVDGYCTFLEELIDSYGDHIATLQVCEEPNVSGNPNLDGWFPRVAEAIINGVSAAKAEARRCGRPDLKVGCNSTASSPQPASRICPWSSPSTAGRPGRAGHPSARLKSSRLSSRSSAATRAPSTSPAIRTSRSATPAAPSQGSFANLAS